MGFEEGVLRERKGDLQGATREYLRALSDAKSPEQEATVLVKLGACLLQTDLDEAEERIGQARLVGEAIADSDVIGEVELLEGRLAQARGTHRLALAKLSAAAERLKGPDGLPRIDVSISLASAERSRGELKLALDRLQSLDMSQIEPNLDIHADYLDELGALHVARGDFRAGVDTLTDALQLDLRIDSNPYKSGRSRLLLAEAYMGRGDQVRSKRLIQEALTIFEHAETGLSEAYALQGRWHEDNGEFAQAARCYRDGLNIDHESDDDLGESRALRRLARVARKRGDHDQATEFLDQARSLLAGSEDDIEIAALMTEEGFLAIELSDYERAVGRFLDALRRIEEDGNSRAVAIAKRNLATAVWETGDLPRAEQLLLDALPVLEALGDLKQLDDLLDDLGEVLLERGQYQTAIERITQSLEIDDQLDTRISRARSLLLLGRAQLEIGIHDRASEAIKQALEIYDDCDDEVGQSDAQFHLGEINAVTGRLRDAIKAFRAALILDGKHNDSVGIARAQRGLAGVYRRRGDLIRAQEFIDDATSELTRITDRAERALLWIEAGKLAMDKGDFPSSEKLLRDAARVFDELDSPTRAATCRRLIGIVLASRGKYTSALEHLETAGRVFLDHHAAPELDQLYDDLGLVYLKMGRPEEARKAVRTSLESGRDLGWSRGNGRSQLILAQIAMSLQDPKTARMHIGEASTSYEAIDDEVGLGAAAELLGDLCVLELDLDGAVRAYKDCRRLQQSHGDTRGLARTFRKLGEVYIERREHQRAEEAFEQAEDHLRSVDDVRERGPLNLARGALTVAMGDHRSGIRYYERALSHFRESGETEKATETFRNLAASHQTLGEYEQSMAYMREMGLEQSALWSSLLSSMHPGIAEVVRPRYLAGEYADAVLAAFAYLEKCFGDRTLDVDERSVSGRIRNWVTPERRGIAPFRDADALKSYQNFCVSAFGILRNSAAHRWREFDGVDSMAAVGVAHLIATLLDAPEDPYRSESV